MYLAKAKGGPEAPLDAAYAFRKLKRWMAEGPTERNRKMAQFLLGNGRLGPRYGSDKRHGARLSEDAQLLINLAVEWNDFAMWARVLKKSGIDKNPKLLGSGPLVRAWSVFPFNVTRPMFVSSEPPSLPRFLSRILTSFISNVRCRFKELIFLQPSTKATVKFIHALRASPPHDKHDAVKWCTERMVATLLSMKEPSVEDVKAFVGIAKTDGLAFFSDTCVQAGGMETWLTRHIL